MTFARLIQKYSFVFLLMVLCTLFAVIATNKWEQEQEIVTITVNDRDTLWTLEQEQENAYPINQWVNEAISLNE